MLGERRTWNGWPRVRAKRGAFIIRGRCVTVERWLALRRTMLCIVVVGGLFLLATSLLGLFWPMMVYSPLRGLAQVMAAVRQASVWLFVLQYPELGRAVWFVPGQVDWHMLCLSLVLLVFRRHVAGLITRLADPIFKTSFRITISRNTITARGGLHWAKADRRQAPVTVRLVSADEYFVTAAQGTIAKWPGVNKHQPPAMLEITQHFGRQRVLFCRRTDQAEAIAAACRRALNATSSNKVRF